MAAKYTDAAETIVEWTDPKGNTWSIPLNSDGETRSLLQEWLDLGNTIDPYVAPDVDSVSRLQFYKQLKVINKIGQVRTLAASWADDSDARMEWEAGGHIAKTGPLVTAVKAELSLTDAQITNFFNAASLL